MSTPARPPASAAPRPAGTIAPAQANQQVMTNLLNLIAMDRDNKLRPGQITQLRTLLANQTRYIVLKHLFERKQNPLLILTPNLDITLPYNGAPALLSKEQFNALVGGAIHEAQRIKALLIPNPEIKEILAMSQEERNAKMAADPQLRQRFQTSVTFYTKGAEGFITPSRPAGAQSASGTSTPRPPSTAPAPASTATPPSQNAASTSSSSAGDNPASGPAVRPPQQVPPAQSGEGAKSEAQETNQTQTPSAPAEDQVQIRPPAPAPQAPAAPPLVKTEPDIPNAPIPPPVAPKPVEPESVRRKRKLQEVLGEMAPGMEFEIGVTEIWSEVLDGFIVESARGAANLAKHRKSEKVGVKDMAFFLDKTYGISVPGFAAIVPERIHSGPEKTDNKLEAGLEALAQSKEGKEVKEGKRKVVAPRAARLLKPRDEE